MHIASLDLAQCLDVGHHFVYEDDEDEKKAGTPDPPGRFNTLQPLLSARCNHAAVLL